MSEQSGSGSVELSRGGTVCLQTVAAQPLGGSVADGPPWPCAPRKGCDATWATLRDQEIANRRVKQSLTARAKLMLQLLREVMQLSIVVSD